MSVNSRFKATTIIGQRKAFCRQTIPEPSCMRKETVDIEILVTSRNVDKKSCNLFQILLQSFHCLKWNMLLIGVIYLIIDTYLLYYPYVQMNLFVIYYLIAYVNSLIHIFFFYVFWNLQGLYRILNIASKVILHH